MRPDRIRHKKAEYKVFWKLLCFVFLKKEKTHQKKVTLFSANIRNF
jgi:hypothetical protein